MIELHPFRNIIRYLDKGIASTQIKSVSSSEKVIVVNRLQKEILHKIPFFGSSNIVYLLVCNSDDPSHIAERDGLTASVKDFSQDRNLPLTIAYRVSCSPGMEEKLALSLASSDNPEMDFEKRLLSWIAKITNERSSEFIENFHGHISWLQNSLADIAYREMGLNLAIRVSLHQENQLEAVVIGSPEATTFTVYTSDSDDPLNLQLQTELVIDRPALALSQQEPGWMVALVNLIQQEIKSYILKEVTLSQFYYELKDTVRNGLASHLNRILYDRGRKLSYLYLDSASITELSVPKELVEIHHTVRCKVQKYVEEIPVENTLQMLPKDVRRYISAQSPNLQVWVENKLEKIIKPLLLGKKYVDLLLDFRSEAESIRIAMQEEAESIGYSIQHIVSLPELEHFELKENLEIKDDGEQFSTNETAIKVALSTTANVKFETFEKIEDYLNQSVSEIKALMQEAINSKTREILRTIDPERFYMRFYVPDEETGEKSVEQELKDEIQQVLVERFGAKVLRVIPITEPTDIIDYLQRLMGMLGSFECEVPSLIGGETVKFRGDFKVQGIERGSWYIFQSVFEAMRKSQEELRQELEALKNQYSSIIKLGDVEDSKEELESISARIREIESEVFGMDDIQKSIEKSIRSKLITVDPQLLQFNDIQLSSTIERYINQWAKESVIEQYGLEISIRHLERDRTQHEAYLFNAQQEIETARVDDALFQVKARHEQRQKQLEMSMKKSQSEYEDLSRLYEQRSKIVGDVDVDQDELDHINRQIKQLEEELLTPSLEDAQDSLRAIEPKRIKGKSNFLFEDEISLPPGTDTSNTKDN